MIKIYIKDKTRGGDIHVVEYDPSNGELHLKNHDIQYEQTLLALGGKPSSCCTFHELATEKGIAEAFMSSKVFSGEIRIRILAECVKIVAPFYDDLVGNKIKKMSFFEDGSRADVQRMVDVSLVYLNTYINPLFDKDDPPFDPDDPEHADYSFDDDSERNISNMCHPAILDMIDSFPEDQSGTDLFRASWYAVQAVDRLQTAISWIPFVQVPESKAIAVELRKSFDAVLTSIEIYFDEQRIQTDKDSFMLSYMNRIIESAAEVTRKYIKEQ